MLTPTSPAAQFSLYIIAAVITGFCGLLLFVAGRRSRGMDPADLVGHLDCAYRRQPVGRGGAALHVGHPRDLSAPTLLSR